MAHSHDHSHGRGQGPRRIALVLGLTSALTVAEVVGGILTGSLALLADAGHMLSDSFSLGLALFAAWLARRAATPARSFGFQRAEILAALANGVTLVAVSIWIFVEAARRLSDPPAILGGWMLAVGVVGLMANLAAALILMRGGRESLNVEAALRHVVADALGSVGVIAAALVVVTTGWLYADPLISILVGLLILASSWTILRDSVNILLEATPRNLDANAIGAALAAVDGVSEVHDLHVWTITSGFPALSAHVLVAPGADCHGIRRVLERTLHDRFGIDHTTLQVDHARSDVVEIGALRRG